MKKQHYWYLSVCQILVERAYYSCYEENQNLRESLWLKLLPQFWSHPNETYCTWSFCREDLYDIILWDPTYGFQSYMPLVRTYFYMYLNIENYVSNSFHSFHFIWVKCATHGTLWSVDVHAIICVRSEQRVSGSWTFFEILTNLYYRKVVSKTSFTVFKSSQWDLLH